MQRLVEITEQMEFGAILLPFTEEFNGGVPVQVSSMTSDGDSVRINLNGSGLYYTREACRQMEEMFCELRHEMERRYREYTEDEAS